MSLIARDWIFYHSLARNATVFSGNVTIILTLMEAVCLHGIGFTVPSIGERGNMVAIMKTWGMLVPRMVALVLGFIYTFQCRFEFPYVHCVSNCYMQLNETKLR